MDYRKQIAELYSEGFEQKMRTMFGNRYNLENVLKRTMNPEMCLTRRIGDELAGIATLDMRGKRFFDIRFKHLLIEYGIVSGIWRFALLFLLDHDIRKGELFVDTLVVKKSFRNQRIGARLLESAEQYARDHDCFCVSLDVVDANERARRFYERQGYSLVKYERLPFLHKRLGFAGTYRMTKLIS